VRDAIVDFRDMLDQPWVETMEAEMSAERLLQQACGEVKAFAPGWDRDRLTQGIWEIYGFPLATRREQEFMPLDRRRHIARLARDMLREIELAEIRFATVEAETGFLAQLRWLRSFDGSNAAIVEQTASDAPEWAARREKAVKCPRTSLRKNVAPSHRERRNARWEFHTRLCIGSSKPGD
jgi:hypothetical protein